MADIDLLIFGCVVFFVAIAGIYVAARENFVYSVLKRKRQRRHRPQEPASPATAEPRSNFSTHGRTRFERQPW